MSMTLGQGRIVLTIYVERIHEHTDFSKADIHICFCTLCVNISLQYEVYRCKNDEFG